MVDSVQDIIEQAATDIQSLIDTGYVSEDDEGLYEAFGGKKGAGKVAVPKTLTDDQILAYFDYVGTPLKTKEEKTSVISAVRKQTVKPTTKATSVASISDKIKDKSLTVGEALAIRKVPAALKKNIQAAGLSMDSPWDSIKETDFLTKLDEVGTESNFTSLNTIENELKGMSSAADIPYPYTTVFGAEGKARKGLNLEKAKQARRTKAFKGVPEAQQSLKALTEGIAAIKDPQTRAAVAFNALVPLRPGEVAGIKIDDIDFETGAFKEAYRRVNKIRNELDLPEVALEILRDAADVARAEGRDTIFDTSVTKMSTAVKAEGGIGPRFKPFAREMGREVRGASDIRKIIPSIIANELGYKSEASAIMGHASFDETVDGMKAITRKHYASQIITGEGTTAKQALRALQNMYGEVLGLSTLNELPASMGVEAKGLTLEGAPKLAVIPKGAEIVGTQVQGTLSDADLDLIEDVRAARSQELKLAATTAEKQRLELEAQMGDLDEEAIRAKVRREEEMKRIRAEERAKLRGEDVQEIPQSDPEARARLQRRGFDATGMANAINKYLGKAIKVVPFLGAGVTYQEAEAAGATPIEAGSRAFLEETVLAGPTMAQAGVEIGEEAVGAAAQPVVQEIKEQVPEEGFLSGIGRAFTGQGMTPNFSSGGFVNRNGR